MTSIKYTGYGSHNDFLNELEELKDAANLRANDLSRDEVSRAAAKATAEAYFYCQHRLMTFYRVPTEASVQSSASD